MQIYINKSEKFLLPCVVLCLVLIAWVNRFVQDDAFISFRYAKHFVLGNGLVWNPGEYVEGYTNFLWTLLIATGMKLGYDPINISIALGLGCFVGTLSLTFKMGMLMFKNSRLSLLAVILLGTNYSFNSYATGGLETPLVAFLFSLVCYFTLNQLYRNEICTVKILGLGIASALMFLTRMDSLVLLFFPLLFVFIRIVNADKRLLSKFLLLLLLTTPLLLTSVLWQLWRFYYYGNFLPNTYYAKLGETAGWMLKQGVFYIYSFLKNYQLIWVLIFFVIFLNKYLVKPHGRLFFLILASWTCYVIKASGDFMEYRMLIAPMPLFFLSIVWLLNEMKLQGKIMYLFSVFIVAASFLHGSFFVQDHIVMSTAKLDVSIKEDKQPAIAIGKALRIFKEAGEVYIAMRGVGAIPYYSDLKTLDLFGLTEPWVARHGVPHGQTPGHQIIAPFYYLMEKGVHLIKGGVISKETTDSSSYLKSDLRKILFVGSLDLVPNNTTVLLLPIDDSTYVELFYINKTEDIDRLIESYNILEVPVKTRHL